MLKTLALGLCVAALATGAVAKTKGHAMAAPNALTAAEKAQGWKLLFDGKTAAGWHNFRKTGVDPGWKIEKGVLFVDPEVAQDIVTDAEYGDFDLVFDWRIGKMGNSGVFYRVLDEGDYAYQTGPEYQLLDNHRSEPPLEQAGGLFGLVAPAKDVTKPVGEFNHGRILVQHGHVEHWLNGVKVAEYDLGSPDLAKRIAGTKFARWSHFATAARGRIGLQNHGDEVAFQNIKIRPLD